MFDQLFNKTSDKLFWLIPILMSWEYLKFNFFCKSIVILFLGRFISRKGDEAVQKVIKPRHCDAF